MGKSSALTAYALSLPALLALAIFRLYPIAATLWGSLNTESFEKAGTSVFAGAQTMQISSQIRFSGDRFG